ncbi:MAG: hypothetical protein WC747_04075 [Candidatus Babeliales bacterium]
MINKKFSLESAYSAGSKIVINYSFFFFVSITISIVACAAYLAALGIIDFFALRHHIAALMNMFAHVTSQATGSLHYAGTSIQETIMAYLPADIASQVVGRNAVSFDISGNEWKQIFSWLVPTAIVLKMFLDMIGIGWTKMALDIDSKKQVSYRYIFEFYYLVPRVFIVNLIVGIATMIGAMFFLVPGIFIFQRLRFARYFIIDKNLSIVKALQASWVLTEGSVVHLFGFTVIAIIIESISHLLILANLFIIPLHYQVEANVYRQMIASK